MATTQVLFNWQNPPELPKSFKRAAQKRGSLLGDFGVQTLAGEKQRPLPHGEIWRRSIAAIRLLEQAAETRRAIALERERSYRELTWLAQNRGRYRGLWVALEGGNLLAFGNSAQEVYAAVAGRAQVPLVTQVEPEDEIYFAGW